MEEHSNTEHYFSTAEVNAKKKEQELMFGVAQLYQAKNDWLSYLLLTFKPVNQKLGYRLSDVQHFW